MKHLLIIFLISCMSVYSANAQFSTVVELTSLNISGNTGEKPQAKVWEHAGKHWAVLPNSSGTYLWRLDGVSWTNVLKLSTKFSSKADCKVIGEHAHVLLFQGSSSQLVSLEYSQELGTYQLWSQRTSTVGLSFKSSTEIATIDIDDNGRMWVAYDGSSDINVRWSDSPYLTWSSPIVLANNVSNDDICAIVAMPGKIGVMWSNQNTERFGFRTHSDDAAPGVWSADEVPASQSALNIGQGMADDHINIAVGSDGTLYAAVKTGYNNSSYPEVALLVRRPSGIWDNLYEVSDGGTRPIVVLNEVTNKIRVIYTERDDGGDIEYNESMTSPISFGPTHELIEGELNNVTSTKDNFSSEIVILSSGDNEVVGVLAFDDVLPDLLYPPLLSTPLNGYPGIPTTTALVWQSTSGAESYDVQVSTSSNFSSLVLSQSQLTGTSTTVTLPDVSTTYYWRVRASNSSGQSDWSETRSFTTAQSSSDLIAHWLMEEGSGNTVTDASEYQNNASITGSPTWVSGVEGLALRFSGSGQYAVVPDNASLDLSYALTIAAWIKPESRRTQYILKKGVMDETDGYELSLANSGKIFFRINQESSGNTYRIDSQTDYPTNGNTWMHVAVTYDGSYMRIYINGTQNSSKQISSTVQISSNVLPLTLGAEIDGYMGYKGVLDDVQIFNRALTANEISNLTIVNQSATASVVDNLSSTEAYTEAVPDSELENETIPAAMPSVEYTNAAMVENLSSTRISQEAIDDEVVVYPNPVTTNATIEFTFTKSTVYYLHLYDGKGNKIRELTKGNAESGEITTHQLDASWLPDGLYFLRLVTQDGRVHSTKLIKGH